MEKSEEFKSRCENVSNSIKLNDDKPGYGSGAICRIGQTEAEIQRCENVTDTNHPGSQGRNRKELSECGVKRPTWSGDSQYNKRIWEFEPNVGRVANGIPGRVDRLKGLGNAIVPQVAYELFKAIVEYENNN
jgi:DNA (cytosine-5)-methyltransferase 1